MIINAYDNKQACTQQAVWRQSGCMLAESLVGIRKFVARLNFSVPPPERQAANRWGASSAKVQIEYENAETKSRHLC